MMANTENIRRWVEALRSGEYRQGRNRLRRDDDTFCCLGVACDISGLGEWSNGRYVVDTQSDAAVLPRPVADWLGVDSVDPYVERLALSVWNDDHHKSFAEIADIIEAEYLRGES